MGNFHLVKIQLFLIPEIIKFHAGGVGVNLDKSPSLDIIGNNAPY